MRLTARPSLAWILAATTVSLTTGLSGSVPTAAASGSLTFAFTGSEQSFRVPAGATRLQFRLVGAPGGDGATFGGAVAGVGGPGAVVTGTLRVTPLSTVYVEVGGPGQGSLGGFNGGARGGQNLLGPRGGGGGGSTDLRLCSATSCPGGVAPSLASRLAIAGGGGGGGGAGDVCFPPGDGGGGGSAGPPPSKGTDGADGGRTQGAVRMPRPAPLATGGAGGEAANGTEGGAGGVSGRGQTTLPPGGSGTTAGGGAGAAGRGGGGGGGGGGGAAGGGGGGAGGLIRILAGRSSAGGGGGGAGSSTARSGSFAVGFDTTRVPGAQVAFLGPVPQVDSVDPSSGPATGGTAVTIAGSGLLGTTAVGFGGTPAAGFQVLSDTTVSALTPAHAVGTVAVTVITPGGTSAPAAGASFTFLEGASLPEAPETGSPAGARLLASQPTQGFC